MTPFARMVRQWGAAAVERNLRVRMGAGASVKQIAAEMQCSPDRIWLFLRRRDEAAQTGDTPKSHHQARGRARVVGQGNGKAGAPNG